MKAFSWRASLAAILLGVAPLVLAVPIDVDFNGVFEQDNDVVLIDFTLEQDREITVFTSSWDDGGIDPIFALWDASENLVVEQDDVGFEGAMTVNGVERDYGFYDTLLSMPLSTGSYVISLSMYFNYALSGQLSDGFSQDGQPNFSAELGCDNAMFCGADSDNDNRQPFWQLHLLGVDAASLRGEPPEVIPVSSSLSLMVLGLLWVVRRTRSSGA